MNGKRFGLFAGFCIVISTARAALAADLYQLPPISVVQYGGYINDVFTATFKNRQVNFDVDLEKGRGFYNGLHGILAVPVKGLNETRLIKDAETPLGAPLCHLFMGTGFELLVDGQPLERSKRRIAKGLAHDGEESESACFVCTVRRIRGKLRLCLFGAEKEPVRTTPLEKVDASNLADFEWTLGTANGHGTLTVSLFGQYEAILPFAITQGDRPPDDAPITTQFGRNARNSVSARTIASLVGPSNASGSHASLLQLDIQRTGYFREGDTLPKGPHMLWRYPAEGAIKKVVPGDPVVDKGVVYFGDHDGQLHALSAVDGTEKWSHSYGPNPIVAAPAIVDRLLYLTTTEDVKCVSLESHRLLWSRELPKSAGETPPLVVGDAVFVAGGDGVYAFKRTNGEPLWKENLVDDRPRNSRSFNSQSLLNQGISMRTRAAASDGTVLFQPIYDQCRVVALDCRTGKRRWSYPSRGWLPTHPAVSGRYVLFGGFDLYLHCVDRETGKAIWKSPSAAEVEAAPAVANGCVYFTARNARVHCVDLESGKRIWMHRNDPAIEGNMFYCAPLVSDTSVFVGSTNGSLCALDASTGEFKWGLSLGNESQINGFGLATDGKRLFAASHGTRDLEGRAGIFAVGD